MARMPKPWRRAGSRGAWYAQVAHRQVRLADGTASFDDALRALGRLLGGVEESSAPSVGEVVTRFLEHCEGRVARGELTHDTASQYTRRLGSFAESAGDVAADHLKSQHVAVWLDSHPAWGSTTRAGCITAVKVAFNWARRYGLLEASPVEHMAKPRARRSDVLPDQATLAAALAACVSRDFALFIRVLHETGCRRSEAMRVEAKDIDFTRSLWHRPGKSTHATGRERIVHLTPGLLLELREQAERFPAGPLLRNTQGRPWTESALNCQIRRLRARFKLRTKKALPPFTFRSLRHLFATDALSRGVPIATVAELLGHSGTKMIEQTYSHLSERHEHLREALAKIRQDDSRPLQDEPASHQPNASESSPDVSGSAALRKRARRKPGT